MHAEGRISEVGVKVEEILVVDIFARRLLPEHAFLATGKTLQCSAQVGVICTTRSAHIYLYTTAMIAHPSGSES